MSEQHLHREEAGSQVRPKGEGRRKRGDLDGVEGEITGLWFRGEAVFQKLQKLLLPPQSSNYIRFAFNFIQICFSPNLELTLSLALIIYWL